MKLDYAFWRSVFACNEIIEERLMILRITSVFIFFYLIYYMIVLLLYVITFYLFFKLKFENICTIICIIAKLFCWKNRIPLKLFFKNSLLSITLFVHFWVTFIHCIFFFYLYAYIYMLINNVKICVIRWYLILLIICEYKCKLRLHRSSFILLLFEKFLRYRICTVCARLEKH